MKRIRSIWTRLALTVLVGAWLLAAPATVAGQGRGGRRADPETAHGGDRAVPRDSGGTERTVPGDRPAQGGSDQKADPAPPSPRRSPDGNTPVGRAVPRSSIPPTRGGDVFIVPRDYYGGYYPWGFGGLGLGAYYGSYYDPWYGGYSGGYPQAGYSSGYEGAMRLKVKPRDASVSVDGYYVGVVDDFDGLFQRLHVEAGAHRIEIVATGYEPLTVDVRIEPDRTVTYRGELKRLP